MSAIRKLWARWRPLLGFSGSEDYWRQRYSRGGDSGQGSSGKSARYKADVLNAFVKEHRVRNVVEFGCGDGRQLQLADYPEYIGYDISPEAIERCRDLFRDDTSKRFALVDDHAGTRADLSMSLDVLFHLVEDAVYDAYLRRLFSASGRFVAIYSSDGTSGSKTLPHVRHRHVSRDIAEKFPGFEPLQFATAEFPTPVPGSERMRFMFYRRISA